MTHLKNLAAAVAAAAGLYMPSHPSGASAAAELLQIAFMLTLGSHRGWATGMEL
jgi:hypothetical protein